MEHGLSPPGRIESKRKREMVKNKSTPWRRRTRLLQVVTGTFPCGQQMQKYGYRKTAACMLCQKARGSSRSGELPKETIGHIQSAGCLGQKEVVTAAHNACIILNPKP